MTRANPHQPHQTPEEKKEKWRLGGSDRQPQLHHTPTHTHRQRGEGAGKVRKRGSGEEVIIIRAPVVYNTGMSTIYNIK
jgi:hypothetical protein